MRFDVEVRVMPSDGGFGGETRVLRVEALAESMAIVEAFMKLDGEGITNVALVKVTPVLAN